ncbi:MAG TPA: site-specific integrase [Spirochaetia bacterium]|nr:site-specific integrase [Spirochaetia bacterium]
MRKVYRLRVVGPLASQAEGYRSELARQGYTPDSVESKIWVMTQLSRWLLAQELGVEGLTSARVEQFLTAQRESGCKRTVGERRLRPLLDYLRSQNALPPPEKTTWTAVDGLLGRYRHYLATKRDLAPRTVVEYESLARKFLSEQSQLRPLDNALQQLTGADITGFLLKDVSRLTVGTVKNYVNRLRSLLRFLYLNDLVAMDLGTALPPVAGWRQTRLPSTLTASQITAILDSCDRSHPTGLRDFAILTVLTRLGLRSAEVANLQLGDVDWRAGEIMIRGKGCRNDRLPLPVDVGESLVAYLCDGRPRTECRSLFLTRYLPLRGMTRTGVSQVVRCACQRIGIPPVGSHRLRHALASEMLRQGAALPEIGQVLRHRDLATTAVYAKIDRIVLRSLAQPWPGGAQ